MAVRILIGIGLGCLLVSGAGMIVIAWQVVGAGRHQPIQPSFAIEPESRLTSPERDVVPAAPNGGQPSVTAPAASTRSTTALTTSVPAISETSLPSPERTPPAASATKADAAPTGASSMVLGEWRLVEPDVHRSGAVKWPYAYPARVVHGNATYWVTIEEISQDPRFAIRLSFYAWEPGPRRGGLISTQEAWEIQRVVDGKRHYVANESHERIQLPDGGGFTWSYGGEDAGWCYVRHPSVQIHLLKPVEQP